MSMTASDGAVKQRIVTQYRIERDSGLDLHALMTYALAIRQPVAVTRDDERGGIHAYLGVPVHVTPERVTLRTADGGEVGFPPHQVDRAAVDAPEDGEAGA